MDKRFKDKTACVTYISFLWGIAMFIIAFILEGWNMDNLEKVSSHPVGILAITLIIGCVVLFILNIRRGEPSPDELVNKRDRRLPVLLSLVEKITKYIKTTYTISKYDSLYNLSNLGLTTLLVLINNNDEYLRLKIDEVGSLVDSINMISKQLQNGRLDRLINQTFQDEHKARSQLIVIRLFQKNYPHLKRNDRKMLEAESQLRKPNNVRKFGKTLKSLYSHIEMMEKGGDLW